MCQKWVDELKLVFHHTMRVDLNAMFYQGVKTHSEPVNPKFGPKFPVQGGEKPILGNELIVQLQLVFHIIKSEWS